jgi:hypothetical protein
VKTNLFLGRLLTTVAGDNTDLAAATTNILNNPINAATTIRFGVDVAPEVARIYGVPADEMWNLITVHITIDTPLTTEQEIHDYLTTLINDNAVKICPTCANVYKPFQTIKRGAAFGSSRRQLKTNTNTWDTSLSLFVTFASDSNSTDNAITLKNIGDVLAANAQPNMVLEIKGYTATGKNGNANIIVVASTPFPIHQVLPLLIVAAPSPTPSPMWDALSPVWLVVIALLGVSMLVLIMCWCDPMLMQRPRQCPAPPHYAQSGTNPSYTQPATIPSAPPGLVSAYHPYTSLYMKVDKFVTKLA